LHTQKFFYDGIAKPFRTPGDGVLIDIRGNRFLAARFTSSGAGKSGKPCERLIALYAAPAASFHE